jgi:putative SOS response-associated peptidase YedK
MCGRFTQFFSWSDLAATLGAFVDLPEFHTTPPPPPPRRPRYNIAPTQDAAVLATGKDGPRLGTMRWGFPNPHRPGEVINARAETAAELPMFRDAMRTRRALIPADAFYEWEPKGDGSKQPWALASRQPVFLLGALWSPPRADTPARFVSLTTATPPGFEPAIHHRMPCVIRPQDAPTWLDPARTDPAAAAALLHAFGDPAAFPTRVWPVSTRVNTPRNDDAALLERSEPEIGLFG